MCRHCTIQVESLMKCCIIYFLPLFFELFFVCSRIIKPRYLDSWPNLYQFLVPASSSPSITQNFYILFQLHTRLHVHFLHTKLPQPSKEFIIKYHSVQVFKSFFHKLEDQGWRMTPKGALSCGMMSITLSS